MRDSIHALPVKHGTLVLAGRGRPAPAKMKPSTGAFCKQLMDLSNAPRWLCTVCASEWRCTSNQRATIEIRCTFTFWGLLSERRALLRQSHPSRAPAASAMLSSPRVLQPADVRDAAHSVPSACILLQPPLLQGLSTPGWPPLPTGAAQSMTFAMAMQPPSKLQLAAVCADVPTTTKKPPKAQRRRLRARATPSGA